MNYSGCLGFVCAIEAVKANTNTQGPKTLRPIRNEVRSWYGVGTDWGGGGGGG